MRLWCASYVALMLVGGALFGNRFYERADPFEVYSTLVRKLSVWGRRDGRLVVRSPLANLDTTAVAPGLVGVVAVLFGSTAFDSFKDSSCWVQFIQDSDDLVRRCSTTWPCWRSARASALIFAVGTMLTGRRRRHQAAASCRTCSRTRSCRSSWATSSPTT